MTASGVLKGTGLVVAIVVGFVIPAHAADQGEPLRDPDTHELLLNGTSTCETPRWKGTDDPDEKTFDEANNCGDGWNGADELHGVGGRDTLYGGPDAAADTLGGGPGADYLFGEDGDDALRGGPGQDLLRGGAGADTIEGHEGRDRIYDGLDADTLTGGLGADTFVICTGESYSQITDFDRPSGDRRMKADCP